MRDYHTREAFEARMEDRRLNPRLPDPVAVFYHISCMIGWEAVVAEQLAFLSSVGLKDVKVFIIGSEQDCRRILQIAAHYGVRIEVLGTSTNLGLYEGPTLNAMHDWSLKHVDGAAFYFHTKGVSNGADGHKRHWRRVMQKYVIADWRRNLDHLRVADVVGCAWQESREFPHFCGNFWAARCDWLSRLQRPELYRFSRPDFNWAGAHSWRDRMYVETWLGSKGWHHVEDRIGKGVSLWNDQVYSFDPSISEFDYDTPFYVGDDVVFCTSPFRWWVIDHFASTFSLEQLPPSGAAVWEARYESEFEKHKRTSRKIAEFPGLTDVFDRLRRADSVRRWGAWLGYAVEDDPQMHGSGVQVTVPGGWLATHLDYDLHPLIPGRRRALNLIVFLNPEWREEWGGALCLCDPMGNVVKRIYPTPGRLIAFEVGDLSYHGVEAVTGPVPRVTAVVSFLSPAGPQNTRRRALFIPRRG